MIDFFANLILFDDLTDADFFTLVKFKYKLNKHSSFFDELKLKLNQIYKSVQNLVFLSISFEPNVIKKRSLYHLYPCLIIYQEDIEII
ncbi:hypothetical protein BpHYR1_041787 [Brachionus plicatilis]|uniref:Uncharacterized protein n=1 Tax=Brachionus plicatilis TaxID=10195 RepID=A0A3M7QHI7_BRAPC|nr:hypothetical protein BpHYR1_041787 [Brachionus plicatilis]